MATTLDILPGVGFVALWIASLRFYWGPRRIWSQWTRNPANDPRIAIDNDRRRALKGIFKRYEEEREIVCGRELQEALEEFEVPDVDLPPVTNPHDQTRLRKNIRNFLRTFDEGLQALVGEELADGPMATGQSRFGAEIAELEKARDRDSHLRRQRLIRDGRRSRRQRARAVHRSQCRGPPIPGGQVDGADAQQHDPP